MGQYYVIANLDKKEVIFPSAFDDGVKLLEMGCSASGTLLGLAVLTCDGNGRGGGDIMRDARWEDNKNTPQPEDWEPRPGERLDHEHFTNDWYYEGKLSSPSRGYRAFVPTLAGTWSGNRIVTAGDYMDEPKYLTDEEWMQGLERNLWQRLEWENRDRRRDSKPELSREEWLAHDRVGCGYSFHDHASQTYTDISKELHDQIAAFGEGRTATFNFNDDLETFLARRLMSDYEYRIPVGRGRKRRWKWLLHWMTFEMLDSFLRRWSDDDDLKQAKAFLRKQTLLPWQRELLKCYLGHREDGTEVIKTQQIEHILRQHGIVRVPENHNRYSFPPVIPSQQYLEAALVVEAKVEEREYRPITIDDVEAEAQLVATEVGVPLRQRVIDLDGS